MAIFTKTIPALGTEGFDDLAKANARIAELEAKVARADSLAANARADYWEKREESLRSFTLAQELVIALGLQGAERHEACAMAIERIEAMKDAVAGLKVEVVPLEPLHLPDHWYLPDSNDDYGKADRLDNPTDALEEWAVENELFNTPIDVCPVFIGRSRYVVVVPVWSDHEKPEDREIGSYELRAFTDEQEAKAFALAQEAIDV